MSAKDDILTAWSYSPVPQYGGTTAILADEAVRMQYAQISAPYQPKENRCSYCGARDNGKDQFCAGCGAPL
jgi:hypothetical protein